MKRLLAVAVAVIPLLAWPAHGAEELSKRDKTIRDVRVWLTNDFVGWLTNVFPEAPHKVWPEWYVNSPSKSSVITWLTNTFPHIDTEEFPQWVHEADEE